MRFYNKVKWILGILMVFFLIVATNLIDKNNFVRVRDSVVSIYEDRLMASNFIYEISTSIQEKELALVTNDTLFFAKRNTKINEDVAHIIAKYEQTKLTYEESKEFDLLKQNFKALQDAENAYQSSGYAEKKSVKNHLANTKENLYKLSKIQLREGSRQMSISKKAVDTVELFTQIEIYLLVFLAIVIQVIVMYSPKDKD